MPFHAVSSRVKKKTTTSSFTYSMTIAGTAAWTFVLFFIMAHNSKKVVVSALTTNNGSAATKKAAAMMHLHWFRLGDLRLHDNPALCRTVEVCKKSESAPHHSDASTQGILPIFCFDPRIFGNDARSSDFGSLKCGARRANFVRECVVDLRSKLQEQGSGLVVAHGTPEDVFERLLCQMEQSSRAGTEEPVPNVLVPNVVCQEEVCSEEKKVEKNVRSVLKKHHPNAVLETVWGSTLYNLEDLPFPGEAAGVPDTFTPFRNKVEKGCKIDAPLPVPRQTDLALSTKWSASEAAAGTSAMEKCSLTYLPSLEDLGYTAEQIERAQIQDERGVMVFRGGETAALARVKDYIWDKDLLKNYFDTRNGMIGGDYSTKFAPWLAHGCVSPRHVAQECKRYEQERVANKSTYWVVFELLWRDYFKFFSKKHGSSIFLISGTTGSDKRWGYDKRHVQAWKEGRTGYPLVDANMRELAATGFMSNRGRQNVCSFLALDMNTDWRHGAEHFETELMDYDVYSNWGNWCSGAGMTGGRVNKFNIVKQSKDYDLHGEYVRQWLPELKDVPTELVHEPWKMTQFQQMEYGVRLGVDYPNPILPPSAGKSRGGQGKNNGGGNGKNGGNGRNGGGDRRGRGDDKYNKRGRGQRQDMKSLNEGTFRMR